MPAAGAGPGPLLAIQKHCFATCSIGGTLAATECILTNGLLIHEVRLAVLSPRCILVGHPRLHDLLQTFAFRSQIVHHLVFNLQCVLKIVDHSLLNLFQLLDSLFVGLTDTSVLCGLGCMRCRNISIVHVPVVIGVLFGILAHGQAVVGTVLVDRLVVIPGLEALAGELGGLVLEVLARTGVVCKHSICVTANAGPVILSSLLVEHALLFFLVLKIHLVHVHHFIVLVTP